MIHGLHGAKGCGNHASSEVVRLVPVRIIVDPRMESSHLWRYDSLLHKKIGGFCWLERDLSCPHATKIELNVGTPSIWTNGTPHHHNHSHRSNSSRISSSSSAFTRKFVVVRFGTIHPPYEASIIAFREFGLFFWRAHTRERWILYTTVYYIYILRVYCTIDSSHSTLNK